MNWQQFGYTTADGFKVNYGPGLNNVYEDLLRKLAEQEARLPRNVEIVVEIDGQRLPVEVSSDLRDKLLAAGRTRKAQYEARDRARREQEQRRAAASSAGPRTIADAIAQLRTLAQDHDTQDLRKVVRRAKRKTHPDTGGSNRAFQLVSDCERLLKQSGRLA